MNICVFAHMMNLSSSSRMVLLISEGSFFFPKSEIVRDPHPPLGGVSRSAWIGCCYLGAPRLPRLGVVCAEIRSFGAWVSATPAVQGVPVPGLPAHPRSDLSGFGPLLMIAELNKASAIEGLGKMHGLFVSIVKTQNYVSLRITFC